MKIIISNAKNQPIYEQIYEQIKNLIITEELEAGQMLPSWTCEGFKDLCDHNKEGV